MRLIDALFALLFLAILLAIFLPIQRGVREPNRRATCMNNIRQVILACHIYESGNQRFPSCSTAPTDGLGESFLVQILPFIDQANLYDDFRKSTGNIESSLVSLSQKRVPLFLCPSPELNAEKSNQSPDGNQYTSHYVASLGPNRDPDSIGYQFTYSDSSVANNPAIGLQGMFSPGSADSLNPNVRGVFGRTHGKRFGDARDGSSNTIALFESSASDSEKSPRYLRHSWAFGHAESTDKSNLKFVFAGSSIDQMINQRPAQDNANRWNSRTLNSNHPAGAMVAMVDGSSQFVSDDISIEVLRAMSGIADGQAASLE